VIIVEEKKRTPNQHTSHVYEFSQTTLQHKQFKHLNFQRLKLLLRGKSDGMPILTMTTLICSGYSVGKQVKDESVKIK
jgi:hypothetical protein